MFKPLTRAEEQIMLALWTLEMATVKEIIEQLPNPKPAYNTVSTIVRILENKEFITHKSFGKGYIYYPSIERGNYVNQLLQKIINGYFSGSFQSLVTFYASQNMLSSQDLKLIVNELKK